MNQYCAIYRTSPLSVSDLPELLTNIDLSPDGFHFLALLCAS